MANQTKSNLDPEGMKALLLETLDLINDPDGDEFMANDLDRKIREFLNIERESKVPNAPRELA